VPRGSNTFSSCMIRRTVFWKESVRMAIGPERLGALEFLKLNGDLTHAYLGRYAATSSQLKNTASLIRGRKGDRLSVTTLLKIPYAQETMTSTVSVKKFLTVTISKLKVTPVCYTYARSDAWDLSASTLDRIPLRAWMFSFSTLSCPVQAETLKRADRSSKESYCMSKNELENQIMEARAHIEL
jgi:hypothetical protein